MKKLMASVTVLIAFFLFVQPVLAFSVSNNPANLPMQEIAKDAPDCYSLDIVFVIDQSSSMGGDTQTRPNDPLGLRYYAPRYALDWLANNRLSRLAQCPDVIHRIGVVSFGTNAVISLPLTQISPNSQNEWTDTLPNLETKITGIDMKKTDTTKGIDSAINMLKNAKPLGDLPRKRALILLTDGQPCTEAMGGYCSDTNAPPTESISDYMKKLASDVNSNIQFSDAVKSRDAAIDVATQEHGSMEKIPDSVRNQIIKDNKVTNQEYYDSIYFWIMATNDTTKYTETVGQTFKAITQPHNGDLIDISQNLVEIPKIFNQVLSKLAGITPTLLGCGNLAVDPYLSGVVLDIYKVANGLEVELNYNGKHIKNGEGDKDFFGQVQYSTYGAVEHYRFQNPPAGLWKIVCSDPNGAEVSYLPFNARPQMQQPTGVLPQYDVDGVVSDPLHPYYLSYRILNQTDNSPLNQDPNYPLDLKAIITDPLGGSYNLPLKFEADGVWGSQDPLHVNLKGVYKVTLSGQAACVVDSDHPNRCPSPMLDVLKSSTDIYETSDVNIFKLKIVEPRPAGTFSLHGNVIPACLPIQTIPVKAQITDIEDHPLEIDKVLDPTANQVLTATLKVGEKTSTITLKPDPTDKTAFIGLFTEPSELGTQTITVEIGEIYQFKDYRPSQKSVTESFSRDDPLFQKPIFYRVLLTIFALILAGTAVWISWLRTFPMKGYLLFSQFDKDTQQIVEYKIGLSKGKRYHSIKKNQVPMQIRNKIQSLSALNQPAKGKKPNRQAVITAKFNENSKDLMDRGQKTNIGGWDVEYIYGHDAGQKDYFVMYLIVISLITLLVIGLSFILPGCGYSLGLM